MIEGCLDIITMTGQWLDGWTRKDTGSFVSSVIIVGIGYFPIDHLLSGLS